MQKIAIHSVPRSGSTWLGEIINSSPDVKYCFQPLFSYRFKDFLNAESSRQDIDYFFSLMRSCNDEFVCQNEQREIGTLPNFEKSPTATHIVYKEVRYHHILENLLQVDSGIKLILLVRNPIEVMDSWINAPKEFNPNWDINEELIEGRLKNSGREENFYGLEAWVKTTKKFEELSQRFRNRIFLINYQSLQQNPLPSTEALYKFCGLRFTDATKYFVNDSTKRLVSDPYSVYRDGLNKTISLNDNLIEKIVRYVENSGLSRYLVRPEQD